MGRAVQMLEHEIMSGNQQGVEKGCYEDNREAGFDRTFGNTASLNATEGCTKFNKSQRAGFRAFLSWWMLFVCLAFGSTCERDLGVGKDSFATIFGLPGQTITAFPTTVTVEEIQYAPYLTGSVLPPLYTVTVTEVDAFVQAHGGTVRTRVTCDETGNAAVPTLAYWVSHMFPKRRWRCCRVSTTAE
jgi:hypothetical protein